MLTIPTHWLQGACHEDCQGHYLAPSPDQDPLHPIAQGPQSGVTAYPPDACPPDVATAALHTGQTLKNQINRAIPPCLASERKKHYRWALILSFPIHFTYSIAMQLTLATTAACVFRRWATAGVSLPVLQALILQAPGTLGLSGNSSL
jgi:hypothetical protein